MTVGWVALAVMTAVSANAQINEFDTVIGTKHDLAADTRIGGDLGTCAYCHVVDDSSGEVRAELNRPPSASHIVLYGKTILGEQTGELSETSAHCMSCHDGATPMDAVGDATGNPAHTMSELHPESLSILGADMNRHHPTGVGMLVHREYEKTSVIADSELRLFDGKIECLTCHDVHGRQGFEKFLVRDNDHGSLCVACHIGK